VCEHRVGIEDIFALERELLDEHRVHTGSETRAQDHNRTHTKQRKRHRIELARTRHLPFLARIVDAFGCGFL